MSVTIRGQYAGATRVRMTHPSGAELTTSAPADNRGDGSLFSPTDLAVASLASCALTIMSFVAEDEGVDFSTAAFEAEKVMSGPPRRIGEVRIAFRLPADLTDKQRKKIEAAAATCPVQRSLGAATRVTMTFAYD